MSRYYAIQTWVGSHENEPGYSGEQCGQRQSQSKETSHFTKNGSAAIHNYSDDVLAKPQKKKVPIASKILSQNVTLNRLDDQQEELDKAYQSAEVSAEEYEELSYVLEVKRDRAHKSLCKAFGKGVESEVIGELGDGRYRSLEGLESYVNSPSLSTSEGWIEKNVEDDAIFFLIGSVICFSLLLWLTN